MNSVKGWKTKRFDEIGTIFSGSTPSTSIRSFWDGKIVWVTPNDLSKLNTPYLCDSGKRITEKGLNGCSAHLLPAGSLVMSSRAPIGYVALPTVQFCINQGCKTIKLKSAFHPEFTYYNLLFNMDKVKNLGEGTTFAEISKTALSTVELSFPTSLHEQTQIAEILLTVDRTIEQTEALIAKQQRIKTGLMQDLLTRGIDEHGNLRSEQTHEFKDSPLGRIPVEWVVLKWTEVCSKIQDGTHFSPRTDSSAEFKYVTSKNIKFGFLDISNIEYIDKRQHDEIYKRCDVCLGDVLLTKDGANTGNCAINLLNEEFSLLSSVAFIRPMNSKLTSMFMLQTILSEYGQRLIKDAMSGLAITRVTLEIINNFLLKVPPIQEQKNIGQFLDVQDERIKSETKKLAKLRSLKTALMQDLLTGKKRVTALLNDTEVASL